MQTYNLAALGGTFDHLHRGHHTLLNLAVESAKHVVVGLTEDQVVQYKTYAQGIEPYAQRLDTLRAFLNDHHLSERVRIEPLADLYGPTLTDLTIDCLVVSPLTHSGALVINEVRAQKGLPELPILVCELEKSLDGEHISSTRIRQGLIDRDGFAYQALFEKDLILTEAQKAAVRRPLGELWSNPRAQDLLNQLFVPKPPLMVAVGDATTHFLLEHQLHPDVAICDGKIQRKPFPLPSTFHREPFKINSPQETHPGLRPAPLKRGFHSVPLDFEIRLQVSNPAGSITKALVHAISEAYLKKESIFIEGEEDLALLPAILQAPLNSVIFYGQPNEGLVVVKVTEEKKGWVKRLLTKQPILEVPS